MRKEPVLISLVILLGGAVAGAAMANAAQARQTAKFPRAVGHAALMRVGARRELHVIVLVNPRCSASTSDSLLRLLQPAIAALRERARKEQLDVAIMGVATSQDLETGITFLKRLPSLDEIAVGRSWLNHAMLDVVASNPSGPLIVPQVVLSLRPLQVDSTGLVAGDAQFWRSFPGLTGIAEMPAFLDTARLPSAARAVARGGR